MHQVLGCSPNSQNVKVLKEYDEVELLQDLHYLTNQLKKTHPGLYWYNDQDSFVRACSIIENGIQSTLTELEFLRLIGQLNSTINCAHTDIRPSKTYQKYLLDTAKFIPFNVQLTSNGYTITENFSEDDNLSLGVKVLTINQIPVDQIVDQLLPYIPADGYNLSRKYHALQKGFYWYYHLYIDSEAKHFNISYLTPSGVQKETIVKGITKKELNKKRMQIVQDEKLPISFQFVDSLATGILKISSFRNDLIQNAKINYTQFIADVFTRLDDENGKNLIIDLRGNEGGYSEFAAELYAYLSDTTFTYCQNQYVTSDTLFPEISYDIPAPFEGFPNGIVMESGRYKWTKHSVLGPRPSSQPHFNGNVYFIIDGGCSSTTSEFASLAKANNVGFFVGEEVGGCTLGNSGGVLGWIELPNTKIRARIAMVKYEITSFGSSTKRGVLPDYPISYSVEDKLANKDLEMDFLLTSLLKK